ncbi:glycosyl hydrolase 115 family protein [Bacteroides thetaiotaomicron]|uniref:glycosyl hydrolase 115 family protein n=1 Tax=Bacteroides thetaiotaomicron TaxID=818 RepID=UPI001C375F06|nr:glycosyl hydrolase 115 family protein [Bacteroides thetaiotaomicron]MBV4088127.1 glycosyl hydrolase 115 family protein [Bacteroides thetaiotaomicron]MBV4100045.1 glycosyl hydrolase 115 family protein [Bacteroides thetaiotaomicron]MBV4136132.1 glycosyl hydrolase 115 family protein [Bacteroides thetaiotaomicron]
MRNRILFSFLAWVAVIVSVQGKQKDFVLQSGQPVAIACSGSEAPVVRTSLDLLSRDLQTVLSATAHIDTNTGNIIVGTIGQSKLIEQAGIDISALKNKKQAFMLAVSEDGKLVVAGSDSHGTAYGILEISRLLGVSPWEWWADVTPEKKETFRLSGKFRELQSPSVEYRGIFINDEDWGLMPWSNKTYEPSDVKGEIGPRTNERIFELLLRLRANTYWPAMHECTLPFFLTKGNREAAKKYGIFMGASHCEPMACNAAGEWKIRGKGAYDYVNNSPAVYQFWEDRVKEVAGQEILYTLGMRGVHDGKMQGAKTVEEQKAVLDGVFVDQRGLLEKYVNKDVTQVPQVFIPYKEVLDIYHAGLQVPEDVTLMWCDDNYGYIRHFPTAEERARKGGNGVYYHVSYWGRPHDHLWLSTMSPSLIYQQMKQAYDQGIQKMWILNVGDIKPAEYQIELFMDMAWNLDKVSSEGVTAHLKHWLERELGTSCAKTILSVMQEHYRLAHIRKPEFMGNTREEEKNPVYRVVKDLPWSEREINERLNAYSELSETVEKAASKVPAGRQSAYFELVKYPVQAATQMNRKLLYAQLARHDKEDWEKSDAAYDSIAALTQHYNSLENGKWNRMMDFKPRKLPVFNRVERKAATAPMTADRKAVCQWNAAEAKKGNAIVCEGLGYESKAAEIKKGDALTFSFGNLKTDSVEVDIRLLPNHPVHGDKLRFTVSLDGAEPEVIAYETKGRSEEWKENVLRNQAIRKIVLPVTGKKSHQLVIKALDEGVILDQVMLYEVNRNSSGI